MRDGYSWPVQALRLRGARREKRGPQHRLTSLTNDLGLKFGGTTTTLIRSMRHYPATQHEAIESKEDVPYTKMKFHMRITVILVDLREILK